jgi:hypothetical protein
MVEYGIPWSSIEIYGSAILCDRDYISNAKNDFDFAANAFHRVPEETYGAK